MKTMTKQEIIKALECCAKHDCIDCPMREKDNCTTDLYKISLQLIKRLEEDIEVWKTNWEELHKITMHRGYVLIENRDEIKKLKAEIERYKKENNEQFNKWELLDERTKKRYAELYEEAKGVVRAEAVREFAEKLKATPLRCRVDYRRLINEPPESKMVLFVDDSDIDELVKEMEVKE